jgi:hypothetical protein
MEQRRIEKERTGCTQNCSSRSMVEDTACSHMAGMLAIPSAMLPSNSSTADFNIVNSDEAELCLIAVFDLTLEFTCNSVAFNTCNIDSIHRHTDGGSTKRTSHACNKLHVSALREYLTLRNKTNKCKYIKYVLSYLAFEIHVTVHRDIFL